MKLSEPDLKYVTINMLRRFADHLDNEKSSDDMTIEEWLALCKVGAIIAKLVEKE